MGWKVYLPIFSKCCLVLWLLLCLSPEMFCEKLFAVWQKNQVLIQIKIPQHFFHRIWFPDKKSATLSFPSSKNLLHYLVNLGFHSMLNLVKLCVSRFNSKPKLLSMQILTAINHFTKCHVLFILSLLVKWIPRKQNKTKTNLQLK